ncbi:hypothetical protein RFI_18324 [Reticulomyxa filosa]|uniref:Uncharacterized protein n=1 Tax=Reticulomyxa filosa TaxID=46433 RepID=X6MY31_RETFI|nr:hypothetical protein RFI_18324 [Reticulomyxa filosa]|eukprot:ETO18920.1 hypothetical protein RFI_18324 [Reticulomyxa filosa]
MSSVDCYKNFICLLYLLKHNYTQFKCRVFIEVSKDNDVREEVTVWVKKAKTVEAFVNFVKSEWKSGLVFFFFFGICSDTAVTKEFAVQLFVADEDGDLDEDFPALQHDQVLSNTGLNMFYLKVVVSGDQDRNNILGRFTVLQQEQEEYVKTHSKIELEKEKPEDTNAEDRTYWKLFLLLILSFLIYNQKYFRVFFQKHLTKISFKKE